METALPFAFRTIRNGGRMEAPRAQFWAGDGKPRSGGSEGRFRVIKSTFFEPDFTADDS